MLTETTANVDIRPATGKLGILLPGMGAVGTTFIAGCLAIRKGLRPLYDLSRDPDCIENLAAEPRYQELKQQLESQMVVQLKAQGDPRMEGRGELFDQYEYANPGTRHFYERYLRGEKVRAGWVNDSDFQPLEQK